MGFDHNKKDIFLNGIFTEVGLVEPVQVGGLYMGCTINEIEWLLSWKMPKNPVDSEQGCHVLFVGTVHNKQ